MPNNHKDKKSNIDDQFELVLWGPEQNVFGAIVCGILALFGGGAVSGVLADAKLRELGGFGVQAAQWLLRENEGNKLPVYGGMIQIDFWERPFLPLDNTKVYINRSHRVYIALKKRRSPAEGRPTPSGKTHILKVHSFCSLPEGDRIVEQHGKFELVVQGDGNVVVYKKDAGCIWATNTHGKCTPPFRLKVQADGNVVLGDAEDKAIWETATWGRGKGPYRLLMQNDGNVVLYDSANCGLWASNTAGL